MSTGRLAFDPSTPGHLWFAEGMSVWSTDDVDASEVLWQSNAVGMEILVASGMVVPPGGVPNSAVADRQGFHYDTLTSFPTHPLVDERFVGGTSIDYSGGHPDEMVWVGAEYQRYFDRQPRGASSNDGGKTWTEFSGLVPDMFGGEVAISATDPNTIVWLPTYYSSPSEFRDKPRVSMSPQTADTRGRTKTRWEDSTRSTRSCGGSRVTRSAADKVDGSFYLMSEDQHFFTSDDGAQRGPKRIRPPASKRTPATSSAIYRQYQARPGISGRASAPMGCTRPTTRDKRLGIGSPPSMRPADCVRRTVAGSATPTAYMYGRANGEPQLGVWRSTDDGATWSLLGHYPLGSYAPVQTLAGDPNVAGRVYVGFAGSGFAYGDDPRLDVFGAVTVSSPAGR